MRRVNRPKLAWLLAPLALIAGGVACASSSVTTVLQDEYRLQPVGSGDLRWLGMRIYRASLWTPEGRFDGYEPGKPVALSLDYHRPFSRAELVRITGTAWRLLGQPLTDERKAWLARLGEVWSDVQPGQKITTIVIPGHKTLFYDGDRLLGEIDEPEFGPAFLSIWLDPRTVVADLRQQLLGDAAGKAAVD